MFIFEKRKPVSWFAILVLALQAGCVTTHVPPKSIEHVYEQTEFTPPEQQKLASNGLRLTVTPVPAATLNQLTFEYATRDGGHEVEFHSERENDEMSAAERRRYKRMQEVTVQIEDMLAAGTADDQVLLQLILDRLWLGTRVGRDGSEIEYLSEGVYPSTYNPYKVNDSHLSVFRIRIENESDSVRTLDFGSFQIASGVELLYPFRTDYFEAVFPSSSSVLTNAYRMNLPDELLLPPRAIVEKYVSVPALSNVENTVSVQVLMSGASLSFDFTVDRNVYTERKRLNGRQVFTRSVSPSQYYDLIWAVRSTNGATFPLSTNIFYVDDQVGGSTVDVCGLAVTISGRQRLGCIKDANLDKLGEELLVVPLPRM